MTTPPQRSPSIALSGASCALFALVLFGGGLGCGEASEELGGIDMSPVVPDSAGPDAQLDGHQPPDCLADETCRQSVSVGPCEEARCIEGACQRVAIHPQMPCDDGNPCTEYTRCEDGVCAQGQAVHCDDANPCTTDQCDSLTGCAHVVRAEEVSCDDADPCTSTDRCSDGACIGDADPSCACDEDGDCEAFEDGNLCNGTLRCQGAICALDPATVVPCPEASECAVSACTPSTGTCMTWPVSNGVACEDGDPCSQKDTCQEGACAGGEGVCACETATDCAAFQIFGYNLCLGPLECVEGGCVPDATQAILCEQDEEEPCFHSACQPATGLCDTVPMDAGTCTAGVCTNQVPVVCGDGGPCMDTPCVPGEGCVEKPVDDGTTCSLSDPCEQEGSCVAGTCETLPISCNDGNPCTADTCESEGGGCTHAPQEDGTTCTSTDPCLELTTCTEGVCAGGEPVVCEQGPCEVLACDGDTGVCVVVETVPDGDACNSEVPCDTPGTCEAGACYGAIPCDPAP
jgi:hypothetical protein